MAGPRIDTWFQQTTNGQFWGYYRVFGDDGFTADGRTLRSYDTGANALSAARSAAMLTWNKRPHR